MGKRVWPKSIPLLREDELVRERWSHCGRYCLGGWVAHVFNDGKYFHWDEAETNAPPESAWRDPRLNMFSKRLAKNLNISGLKFLYDFADFFDGGVRNFSGCFLADYLKCKPPSKKEVAKAWNKTVRSFGYTQTIDRR